MLDFVDKVLPTKESFICNSTIQKALILCEVLKQADIRRVTPYIAAKYGEEFGTGWKDNKDLIKKFYKTHMPELYAYNAYKLNKILEYLIESIPTLLKQTTIRLDGAVIDNLNNLTDSLTKSDSSAIEIESALCTTVDDLLSGKPCIRRPIVNEFELLNKIVQCNIEINKEVHILLESPSLTFNNRARFINNKYVILYSSMEKKLNCKIYMDIKGNLIFLESESCPKFNGKYNLIKN